jgi:periplasmic protein TonB
MFEGLAPRSRFNASRAVSLAVHAGLLAALLAPASPRAVVLVPMATMRGDRGSGVEAIFMPAVASETGTARRVPEEVAKNAYVREPKLVEPAHKPETLALDLTSTPPKTPTEPHQGTELGLFAWGLVNGHDVRPALPVVFPSPKVALPSGVKGDVVVEVTIDESGNVIGTRLLRGLEQDIDDAVVATLETWRFTPATLDGKPIPSQHDVHFHFPS